MKHLLLLTLGFSGFGFSQITLTSNHFPAVNDTLRMSKAVISSMTDFASTGADYTWDFSQLQNNTQKVNTYSPVSGTSLLIQVAFGNFAPTKYRANYYTPATDLPLNNLPAALPITISDINQFYRVTTDSMTLVGMSLAINGQTVPAKSDTIETRYQFPLEFGNTHHSRGYTNLDLNPAYNGIWRQHRYHESEVDGWGEITTPYGTFDVLRIHHRIEESDSFYVNAFGFASWVRIPVPVSHEYEWRATTEKEPILLVKTSETQGAENVTAVEFRNHFVLGLKTNEIDVKMYPNPAKDILVVSSAILLEDFKIISMDGKEIFKGKLSGLNQNVIELNQLDKGSYFIQLNSASGTNTQTFIKI